MSMPEEQFKRFIEVRQGTTWPSRGGKFKKGQVVSVVINSESAQKRFKGWASGKPLVVTKWRRAGQQSEYRVRDSETGKERWIWADALEPYDIEPELPQTVKRAMTVTLRQATGRGE